ncbi:hypothetical protein QVD17_05580 [Tagetes erecta]|uniref:Uncharacterized protein n=1 Tax=Tagetes erecta TaxID=13708 RepID=A0AAD8LC88_TARER|nr:hypothetical protein QVD17_05580 [Tagetes erecta]
MADHPTNQYSPANTAASIVKTTSLSPPTSAITICRFPQINLYETLVTESDNFTRYLSSTSFIQLTSLSISLSLHLTFYFLIRSIIRIYTESPFSLIWCVLF